MKIKAYLLKFLLVFCLAFVVNILVTLLWNYFIRESGAVIEWDTAFTTAITFAILIPAIQGGKRASR